MAVNFSESKTKENLMRAFAGESQARNRYTFAAEQCRRGNAVDRRHFSVYGRSGAGTCTEILRIVKTGNGDDNFLLMVVIRWMSRGVFRICCRRQPTMKMKRRWMCIRLLRE